MTRHHPPALIETIRVRQGAVPLWYLHLRRLAVSCKALGVPLPGELPPPEGGPDRVHRLEVGMRGAQVSERLVGSSDPVKLIVSRVGHHSYPYKTTDRAQFERALDTARGAEADDALLLTPGGFVAETAIYSVLWWEVIELVGQVEERRSAWSEIRGSSLFLVNSVRGIVKVAAVQGERVPPSKETDALAARFWP
jgi:branched-subunit amino acid aminotransferase/4-amino-4-deoxychorismate lyase